MICFGILLLDFMVNIFFVLFIKNVKFWILVEGLISVRYVFIFMVFSLLIILLVEFLFCGCRGFLEVIRKMILEIEDGDFGNIFVVFCKVLLILWFFL